ncbi:DUF2972 domain-containing protein, partial [Helicobacter rodentium]|uniref:DUF2972 domain-containing protein n=1 Tax=Helicobacter rodentium TaxID=59617 RepID=UPI0023550731
LDYLKNNPLLSNKFDNILEEHLAYIKQVRPDIVESWKYYGEFKKLTKDKYVKNDIYTD